MVFMYIEKVPNRNSPSCVLVRESFRDGGKVHKRTLANISHLPDDIVESIDLLLKGGRVFENFDNDFQIVRSLPYANVKQFDKITTPTPLQQKALTLLKVRL